MTIACKHCGVQSDNDFCCEGCAAVYSAIQSEGWLGYYDIGRPTSPAQVRLGFNQSLVDSNSDNGAEETTWRLDGLHCQSCVWLIAHLPQVFDDVGSVNVDVASGRVRFIHTPQLDVEQVARWFQRFGFQPHNIGSVEQPKSIAPIGFAWALAANTMAISIAFYAGLDFEFEPQLTTFAASVAGILTLGSLVLGRTIFVRAFASLKAGNKISIDVPIALGVVVAFTASLFALGTQSIDGLWFDSISVLIAALLTSRWINAEITRRIRLFAAVEEDVVPPRCIRIVENRRVETITSDLNSGDRVEVEPLSVFPCDGRVQSQIYVDRQTFNGESEPVEITSGEFVRAGERALSACEVVVTATGSETVLAQILRGGEPATNATVEFADSFAAKFTGFVLLAALVGGITGMSDGSSLTRLVSVLLIACPCAAAMATPLGFTAAIAAARRAGFFIRSEAVLESLASVSHIVFDKTGTLTTGKFSQVSSTLDFETLQIAAALERQTNHPIASAFSDIDSISEASDVTPIPFGVSGTVDGRFVQIVKSESAELKNDVLEMEVWVDEQLAGVVVVKDDFDASVRQTLSQLQTSLSVLSGDRNEVVASVCNQLGIRTFAGRCSPVDKAVEIQKLKRRHVVAFVGDGLNDAPAFRSADVSICVHGAHANNYARADVLFTEPGLSSLPRAIELAKRTTRLIQFALAISIFYNVVAVGFAVAGFVTPLVAAVSMPISSIVVIAIASRCGRVGVR